MENVESITNSGSQLSSLKELAELKEQDIITQAEFEEGKKKILLKI